MSTRFPRGSASQEQVCRRNTKAPSGPSLSQWPGEKGQVMEGSLKSTVRSLVWCAMTPHHLLTFPSGVSGELLRWVTVWLGNGSRRTAGGKQMFEDRNFPNSLRQMTWHDISGLRGKGCQELSDSVWWAAQRTELAEARLRDPWGWVSSGNQAARAAMENPVFMDRISTNPGKSSVL